MGCTQSHSPAEQDNANKEDNVNGDHNHPESSGDDTFSHQHKDILKQTWKQISIDRQDKGIAIFVKIFNVCPDAQMFFPFKDCTGDDLLHEPRFRSHALRFINAVDTTIQGLDAPAVALVPVLHHLGKIHGWIPGFLSTYLPVFMDAILYVFEQEMGDKWTQEVSQAWNELADFIAAKVTEGYTLHQEEQSDDSTQVKHMQNPHMYNSSPSPNKVSPIADSNKQSIEYETSNQLTN